MASNNTILNPDKIECIEHRDLYKELAKRIENNEDNLKPYLYIEKLGFGRKMWYTIDRFRKGAELDNGMSKPLHEKQLSKLCSKLGIKFHRIMFLVEL